MSPFVCGAEAPPRLCDPPCSEEQAGIGPISQKPELLTLGWRLVAVDQMCKVRRQPRAADRLTRLTSARPQGSPEAEDHTLYASHTVWENRAVFEAWTKSEAFRAAPHKAGDNKPLYLGHPEFEGFEVCQTVGRGKAEVA